MNENKLARRKDKTSLDLVIHTSTARTQIHVLVMLMNRIVGTD